MKLIAFISFIGIVVAGKAQQLPQFTQFGNNVSLINASNFVNDKSSIHIGARSQMIGFGSEPNSSFVYGHCLLKKKSRPNYNPPIACRIIFCSALSTGIGLLIRIWGL